MLMVNIRLDGPARGKGRPRATVRNGHAAVYTDEKTVKYESQLRFAAMQEMAGRPPTAQPIALVMTVRFAIPTTWSKKKHAAALLGHLRPTVKPDADNTLKLTDALNGIVWLDDKQVVDARVRKVYAETPGLLIEIHTIAAPVLPEVRTEGPRRGEAPLFDLTYDETADAIGSYDLAVRAVGERVKAGEPVPAFFHSEKPEPVR